MEDASEKITDMKQRNKEIAETGNTIQDWRNLMENTKEYIRHPEGSDRAREDVPDKDEAQKKLRRRSRMRSGERRGILLLRGSIGLSPESRLALLLLVSRRCKTDAASWLLRPYLQRTPGSPSLGTPASAHSKPRRQWNGAIVSYFHPLPLRGILRLVLNDDAGLLTLVDGSPSNPESANLNG